MQNEIVKAVITVMWSFLIKWPFCLSCANKLACLCLLLYWILILDTLTRKINLWGNQSILGCLYCTIECCILLVKLALAERALHRCCRGQGFKSCTSLNFFRLSFRNCKRCVYNCNDLLSYYSSARSSHI